jgi:hypothetical protein
MYLYRSVLEIIEVDYLKTINDTTVSSNNNCLVRYQSLSFLNASTRAYFARPVQHIQVNINQLYTHTHTHTHILD